MKETTNRPVPEKFKSLYTEKTKGESLFLIVGDLNLKGKYGESMLAFTKDKLFAFDECFSEQFITVDYKDIEVGSLTTIFDLNPILQTIPCLVPFCIYL